MSGIVPDAAAFVRLARPGTVVPVVLELQLPPQLDPLAVFAILAEGEPNAALLETSEAAAGDADISVVTPVARAVVYGADVLDQVAAACVDEVADIGVPLPRFVGGAIGMLAHEHVRTIEPRVPAAAGQHPAGAPEAAFLLVDTLVVFEHRADRVRAIHSVRIPDDAAGFDAVGAHAAASEVLERVARRLAASATLPAALQVDLGSDEGIDAFADVETNLRPGAYEEMVEAAREAVHSGECVQVVVSQRFSRPCTADPLLAYRALRSVSPAPYHLLLRIEAPDGAPVHLIGASPEQLVGVLGGTVVTHPIAGTRRRGADPAEDTQLEEELLADPKERAEHMMLVDLGRNDVGRVSKPGTVEVPRLCEVERFSHVMHLVSRVEGTLDAGRHPVDALRSAFPAGTLTGAPKVRAMELIAQLEPDQRGPYGGAVGYVGHGRTLDMAIAIRTAVLAGGQAHVQAGAGVVSASDARAEEQETRAKARAALHALAVAEAAARVLAEGPEVLA